MVSSAEMALRRVFDSHRSSLWSSGLWSSPIGKLAIKLFTHNAPKEYLLLAQK